MTSREDKEKIIKDIYYENFGNTKDTFKEAKEKDASITYRDVAR